MIFYNIVEEEYIKEQYKDISFVYSLFIFL